MNGAPDQSAGHSPVRPKDSVRRTSTIDTSWPEGQFGPMKMIGRARDVYHKNDLKDEVIEFNSCEINASPQRQILALKSDPDLRETKKLVGVRAGGQSRAAILEHFTADQRTTPLHLLLDDFAGASLVAGWAWSRWTDSWDTNSGDSEGHAERKIRKMEGICAGFRPGASSLNPDGSPRSDVQSSAEVGSLINPDDPHGWHELPAQDGVGMRRARWIDVWEDGNTIKIEAGFQDSSTEPRGGRRAVHEYWIKAEARREDMVLTKVTADANILPYRECPAAAPNIDRVVGLSLTQMRREVIAKLPGTLGCTHLNDVLRGLEDVPTLIKKLEERKQWSEKLL